MKDGCGYTPLARAAEEGHEAVAKLLVESGADFEAKDDEGYTPLQQAEASGHENVFELLKQYSS